MAWKLEDDPQWSLQTLRALAEKPCVRFKELAAAGHHAPFCGRCNSCIASRVMILIYHERGEHERVRDESRER